jgi:RecA-family ATPase
MAVKALNQLTALSVAWLWPDRLALGKLAILDGDPGQGKSLVTLDLCSRLSNGQPWPDGGDSLGPASSIILNSEDDEETTIIPRLKKLGANLSRVFVHDRTESDTICLPGSLGTLEKDLISTGAKLVVLDPVVSFLSPHAAGGRDGEVRQALIPLANLAHRHQCAVLMVRHLSKLGSRRSLYRGVGSIAFVGVSRSAWLVASDPDEANVRILAQVKNNLASRQPSLAYEIVAAEGEAPAVDWIGERAWKADELLEIRKPPPLSPRERSRDFLEEFLKDGPRTSREIWLAARKLDFSKRTMKRAKEELEIRSRRVHQGLTAISYWLLPGQKLPAHIPQAQVEADLEELLKPLREEFPPPTPLDEM